MVDCEGGDPVVVVDNPSVVRSTNAGNCGVPDVVSGQVATAHSGDSSFGQSLQSNSAVDFNSTS